MYVDLKKCTSWLFICEKDEENTRETLKYSTNTTYHTIFAGLQKMVS